MLSRPELPWADALACDKHVLDLVRSQSPHGWPKLEYLAAATMGIMNAIFRPPDHLPEVIGSSRKAIISTREWGKSSHLVVLPNEPEVDIADVVRRAVESRATPSLPERLRIGGLRNAHDYALGILHVPRHTAVWSTECAEVVGGGIDGLVGCRAEGVGGAVADGGVSDDLPAVVDVGGITCRAAERP